MGKDCFGATRRLRAALLTSSALALAWMLPATPSRGSSNGTWLTSPASNDYGTGSNWDGGFVPAGTAFFGTSNTTSLSVSGAGVHNWVFNAGASNYSFDVSGPLTFSGGGIVINGGSATITNNNSLTFMNGSTAGSASIVNNGQMRFTDVSTAGNATIINNNQLTFDAFATAGSAVITNSGNVLFDGDSTPGNAQLINVAPGAVINFFTPGLNSDGKISAGSIAGNGRFDLNGAELTVGGNNLSTVVTGVLTGDGSITGTSLIKVGTGTLTLSGANTFTGGVTLNAGTLKLANNNALGTGALTTFGGTVAYADGVTISNTIDLRNTTTFQVDAGSATQGGVIGETGTAFGITKTGGGTLGLSGTNTYTGATTIDGGVLRVDGSIETSSGVTVNANATLMGTGAVSGTAINSGGSLLGGNGTAGTSLAISGNLAFQSGAYYLVEVNPATASFVNVAGTAILGGATVNAVFVPGSYVAKQYTILTAGSVSGTFGSLVDTNLPSNFHTELSYDANHAYLNLILTFVPPPGSGLSGNQQKVGNAIINSFNSNGGISLVYSALTGAGLTQASGETAAGSQQTTFQAMGQFMGLLTDPFSTGRETDASAPPAYADTAPAGAARDAYAMLAKAPPAKTFEQGWSVWAAGFGGSQTTDGNTAQGSNSATSRLFGTAAGAEYAFSPQTLAGFALAGGGTSFSVAGGGSGRSDLFQAGAYLRHTNGPSYLSAALAYGWQDVTTDRTVTLAGVDRLRAEFNANAWSGRVEGGYRFVVPWVGGIGLTPYAAGQFTTFNLPGYAESVVSGGGAFVLAYAAKSVTDTRTELGLRSDKSYALTNAVLTLRGRLAWAHDFNPDHSVAATFQALPGASFVVSGARPAADSALTTASAEMKWLNGWSTAATFEGEFSNATRSYAGKGTVRYAW